MNGEILSNRAARTSQDDRMTRGDLMIHEDPMIRACPILRRFSRARTFPRIRTTLALTLLGVFACASSGLVHIPEEAAPDGVTLSLEIEPYHNGWQIHTNKAVSVALFEIYPNRGVGLLFPDPAKGEGEIGAGITRVLTGTGRIILRHRAAYLSPRGTGGLVGNRNQALNEQNAPITVVAFACECDLNLEELAAPGAPEDVVGPFAGMNVPSAASKLLEAILPSPDESWVSTRYFLGMGGGGE